MWGSIIFTGCTKHRHQNHYTKEQLIKERKTVNWKDNNEERKTSKFLQLTPVITMETSSQIPVFLSLQSNSMHASVIDKLSLFLFIVQKLNKCQKCTIFSFICFFFLVHKRASLSQKKEIQTRNICGIWYDIVLIEKKEYASTCLMPYFAFPV
jgi:hypothetical protein